MTTPTEMSAEEMRVKCAEAMGWKNVASYVSNLFGQGCWGSPPQGCKGMRPTAEESAVPNYPVCNNAAETLRDHLAREGWSVGLDCLPNKPWTCTFYREDNDQVFLHTAPTMAEAICGAFLKACSKFNSTQS